MFENGLSEFFQLFLELYSMYQEICSGQFILNFKKGCIKTRFTKQACKTLLLHKKFILPSLIILYFSLLLELTH